MTLKSVILFLILFRVKHSNGAVQKVKDSDNGKYPWLAKEDENYSAYQESVHSSAFSQVLPIDDAILEMNGTADITHGANGTVQFQTHLSLTQLDPPCAGIQQDERLTQTQLINRLTAPCRYDRFERPTPANSGAMDAFSPVEVFARVYIYVLQNLDSNDLQFKMHGLLQLRYTDPRLAFEKLLPNRKQPILGQSQLRDLIWVPHIFLENEHDSSVLGTSEKDILTSIAPDGTIIVSSRIQATLYCWMDLQKFPFDEQECSTLIESWMHNSSDLILHWEKTSPIAFDTKMDLTEYTLQRIWTNESIINANLENLRHGAFTGNYSGLSFTVHLTREVGYYVMDYFLPSMMIVAISWVSFWLQADQTPARTVLGTSTMLSFITLASAQDNNLAKVSYIKVSEIWFLGCTLFIFGSLVEFAFVNTIWRRRRSLELKKINSKYIFKSTLTPSVIRRDIPSKAIELNLSASDGSLKVENESNTASQIIDNREAAKKIGDSWSTMTPHEVSLWIDRKARFAFPLAFLIFNAFFWTFVYCL